MMKIDCIIALDAGSGSGRSAILDLEGTLLGSAAEDWSPRVPEDEPLGSEFDPQEMWAVLSSTTRRAVEQAGVDPQAVRGISATSQRDGAVFLDADGRELHCSTNRDARGVLHAEDIAKEFGETIHSIAGRWPLGLGAMARLWWFRVHSPEVYERIARVCMISDWLTYRLCGEVCSEPTNASSSLLFDVVECTWSSELAECLGYSSQLYPPCYYPGERVGTLTASAAEALGLPEGIPVAAGAGDSQAACLGCAAFEDGATTVIAGTTMPVQMVLSHPVFDELHRLHLGAYVTPGRWVLESNGGIAGTCYRWFCEAFVGKGPSAYETLEEEMREVAPGEVLAVLGPQVADFRELSFPPKSTFVFPFLGGTEEPPRRGAFARAILENIAYAARANVEQLEGISGQDTTSLNLCGGLARSQLLAQLIADVSQRPIHVPTVREASSLGAAICAAVGGEIYPDLPAAANAMVHWEPVVEPDPAKARRYRGLYRKWTKLFEKARGL
jgi:sugar (pentulose or hexulose) kinase